MDRPRIISWNWRAIFDNATLTTAQGLLRNNMLMRITMNRGDTASATAEFKTGFRTKCSVPATYTQCTNEYAISPDAQPGSGAASEIGNTYFSCSCSASQLTPCAHMAALLLHWEKERGSFTFRETAQEKQEREKLAAFPQPALQTVRPSARKVPSAVAVSAPARTALVPESLSAAPVLPSIEEFYPQLEVPEHLYYDLRRIMNPCRSSETEFAKARTLQAGKPLISLSPSVGYLPSGEQTLSCKLSIDADQLRFTLAQDRLIKSACTRCHISYNENATNKAPFFCAHQLVAFQQVGDSLLQVLFLLHLVLLFLHLILDAFDDRLETLLDFLDRHLLEPFLDSLGLGYG